jgi:membrane protein implicated in regulation of membrane protease activity
MRIRRTLLGPGLFLFGSGIALTGYENASSDPGTIITLAVILFLAAAILLAWSFEN